MTVNRWSNTVHVVTMKFSISSIFFWLVQNHHVTIVVFVNSLIKFNLNKFLSTGFNTIKVKSTEVNDCFRFVSFELFD